MKLELDALSCGHTGHAVVRELSLAVDAGTVLSLLGPNGVGKTTLLKTLLGLTPLRGGRVLIGGQDVRGWGARRRAQVMAYVPQAHTPPFPFAVIDVVTMGRTAHLGTFASPSRADRALAERTLHALGIAHLGPRIYTELSGGERQMALIARALVQQPDILVLDEPTSNLDFGNQIRVLRQIRALAAGGMAVVMSSHFPDHVFLCGGTVALLRPNGAAVVGLVEEAMTPQNLQDAYGVRITIASIADGEGGTVRVCVPLLGLPNHQDKETS